MRPLAVRRLSSGVIRLAMPIAGLAALLRPASTARATDQQWLQDGFAPPRPDIEELLVQAPPQLLCHAHRIAAVLLLVMAALATVLKVDIIVAASGRLATDQPTIVLQPMQLSVIHELRVRAGDVVRKGDVLAALDPTFTEADRTTLLARQNALRAERNRIEAELNGTPLVIDAATPELLLQATLYQQRQGQRTARLADYDAQRPVSASNSPPPRKTTRRCRNS